MAETCAKDGFCSMTHYSVCVLQGQAASRRTIFQAFVPQVFSIDSLPREADDNSDKLTVSFDFALVCDVADLIFSEKLHLLANTTLPDPEERSHKKYSRLDYIMSITASSALV